MTLNYRIATPDDIPAMAELRKRQLIDEGIVPDGDIDGELLRFFSDAMKNDSLVEWLVEDKEDGRARIIATGAIVFHDFPPTWTNRSGVRGYVTNMYTAPEYRRRGIATALLGRLTREARRRGVVRLWLGASTQGRPVYKKYGFQETDEWMEMTLS